MDDTFRDATWRGIGKELLNDPTCKRPEVISAVVFGAELVRALDATLTDQHRVGPDASKGKRQFLAKSGATIECDIPAATVTVAAADYRCDVAMLPDRVAIRFTGNHGGEGILALYLLDWLHEQGELPTRAGHLSGAELVLLSDLRGSLVDDDPEPEASPG